MAALRRLSHSRTVLKRSCRCDVSRGSGVLGIYRQMVCGRRPWNARNWNGPGSRKWTLRPGARSCLTARYACALSS